MKKILFLTALCLTTLLAAAEIHGNFDYEYRYKEQRTIEKTFDVEALSNLEMEGKYSDFIIKTWDKPQIDFNVIITVKSDKEQTVKKLIDLISVELTQNCNNVKAKTVFNIKSEKSFDASVSIKYYVNVPKDVSMDLETRYGEITIEKAFNKLKADIMYGNFSADSLMIENFVDNQINMKFGNIDIDVVKKFFLRLDYGEAKINKCEYVDGHLRYSKIFITDLNNAMLENKYSEVRIDKTFKVSFVSTTYSDLKVSNCTNQLSADMKYTDLKANMTSKTPHLDIDCQYSDAEIYLDENASFSYELEPSFSDITFKKFFVEKEIGTTGTYGEGEQGVIEVDAKYSDVVFRKN